VNSRTHAATVLTGTTIRNGPGTCRSYVIQPRNEIVWNVFPKPISAARMTFLLLDHEKASQFIKQACRYSRSVRPSLRRKLGCLAIRLYLGQASLSNLCRAGKTTFRSCFPRNAANYVRTYTLPSERSRGELKRLIWKIANWNRPISNNLGSTRPVKYARTRI
jgi:hypothetical protein